MREKGELSRPDVCVCVCVCVCVLHLPTNKFHVTFRTKEMVTKIIIVTERMTETICPCFSLSSHLPLMILPWWKLPPSSSARCIALYEACALAGMLGGYGDVS